MEKVSTVILCASAMSSGLIVTSLKEEAKKRGIEIKVECFASLRYRSYDYNGLDVVLLAPQVKNAKQDVEEHLKEKGLNIPVKVIEMRDYGLIRGSNILEDIIKIKEEIK